MKKLALVLSGAALVLFFANVGLGAVRKPVILSDVQEMLVLFSANFFFVVAVLLIEREGMARTGPSLENREETE